MPNDTETLQETDAPIHSGGAHTNNAGTSGSELASVLEKLQKDHGRLRSNHAVVKSERDSLKEENERLRKQVDQLMRNSAPAKGSESTPTQPAQQQQQQPAQQQQQTSDEVLQTIAQLRQQNEELAARFAASERREAARQVLSRSEFAGLQAAIDKGILKKPEEFDTTEAFENYLREAVTLIGNGRAQDQSGQGFGSEANPQSFAGLIPQIAARVSVGGKQSRPLTAILDDANAAAMSGKFAEFEQFMQEAEAARTGS